MGLVDPAATTDLSFDVDFESIITDKQQFLDDCSATYAPLVCIDVRATTLVIVTMEGDREGLKDLVDSVTNFGFMMESRNAVFEGAFPASSFLGASDIATATGGACIMFCGIGE